MKPKELIKAFDECRDYIFGYSLGRDNPHKDDEATAEHWITAGVTLVVAVMVFFEQMSWMHEKFLRFGGAKDRSYLPASLKVFDDNIAAAIRRSNGGGQSEPWENNIAQWRSRCKAWQRNKSSWISNHWGSEPFEDGCRVPKEILTELSKK